MNNVSRFKVIVSFLALLAVLFFSLYFVHRELGVLTQSEGSNVQWMDSLSVLLKEKDDNTIRILRTLAEANDSLISTAEIEDIITSQDTIVLRPRIQRHVVHHRDTVVSPSSPPKKKGFFKRLRDAFSTPKPDSVIIQVKTSVEYTVDTLIDVYNPIDSLQARLREVVRREREVNDGIRRRKNRLQAVNTQLTARIDTLLKHYEEKTLQRAREDAERRQELRLHSARTIGTIAVGAVLLAAFFLVLIGRDIARNNRYRRELEEARSRAEDLLAARERMMLAITHDFKAPLGSIIGYADLLSRLTVDGRQRFYLDNMKQSSQHLLRLVTDLLDFHRLDLHKAEVHQVPFHPARLLEEVCISFQPLTADKGLELQRQVAPELSAAYVCDPLRLRQIINNLLGMDPSDCERIFREFTRLPGAQGQEGFGLGLSIVRMLVQLLKGTIHVESEPGKGSTFTVRIPMGRAQEEVPANAPEPSVATAVEDVGEAAAEAPRLLLIDDDRIQLMLTEAMLKQQGMMAVSCLQVDELLDALRAGHFDALLTDVQMPAMNGFELLQLLRASNIPQARTIPVIAVTARSDMQPEEFVTHGFSGCLHKPFTVSELKEVLAGVGVAVQLSQALPEEQTVVLLSADAPDFSALTAFSGDDAEAARSIVESFVEETRENLRRIRESLEKDDVERLSAVAHKMLPLFTLIGAKRVVALLRRLEAAKGRTLDGELRTVATDVMAGVEDVLRAVR